MGIGNELREDDSAGFLAARILQGQLKACEHIQVINAGIVPENFIGVLEMFNPGLVIMLDSACMDKAPGEIRLIDWHSVSGRSLSTHTFPLRTIAELLMRDLDCEVILIGIQPRYTAFGNFLSPEVREAVNEIVCWITEHLQSTCVEIGFNTRFQTIYG
jgi:hydrogenase maturation protease HycI